MGLAPGYDTEDIVPLDLISLGLLIQSLSKWNYVLCVITGARISGEERFVAGQDPCEELFEIFPRNDALAGS